MVAFLCFELNIMLLIVTYIRYKTILAPPVLLNLMWGGVNLLNFLLGWNSNEIVYLILSLPFIMFTIGFMCATNKMESNAVVSYNSVFTYSKFVVFIILLLVVSISIVYFYFVFSRIGSYFSVNMWYTLRKIVWLEDTKNIGIFSYPFVPLLLLPTIFIFILSNNTQNYIKYSLIFVFIISFFKSLISTSRTQTFTLIIVTLMSHVVYNINKNNLTSLNYMLKRKRWIIISVILILFVFVFIGSQKNPEAYGESNALYFALKSLINYTNLSSACFVEWYKDGFEYRNGLNSLRLIYAILHWLGMDVDVVNTTSGGLFISYQGYSSNAFTVARNYVEDFGVIYMAFMFLLFGWIHGKTYKKALCSEGRKKIRFSIICGFLYVPLMYQILTDQYLNVLSQWIQYTIWVYILTSKSLLKESEDKN